MSLTTGLLHCFRTLALSPLASSGHMPLLAQFAVHRSQVASRDLGRQGASTRRNSYEAGQTDVPARTGVHIYHYLTTVTLQLPIETKARSSTDPGSTTLPVSATLVPPSMLPATHVRAMPVQPSASHRRFLPLPTPRPPIPPFSPPLPLPPPPNCCQLPPPPSSLPSLPGISIDPNHRPPGILDRKTPEAGPHPCKHGATPGDPKKEATGRRRGEASCLSCSASTQTTGLRGS